MIFTMLELMKAQEQGKLFIVDSPSHVRVGLVTFDGERYHCTISDDRGVLGELDGYSETRLSVRTVESGS